jgi:uncharacterized protein YyaL (SSP411 family)
MRRALAVTLALACAHAPQAPAEKGHGVAWQGWSKETFDRAKAEQRYLLVDCSAEWCHWCHVMDDTTYKDPRVLEVLEQKFVPVRVDIDARPDLAERYSDYGWPATIVLSPDALELGKFRGYMPPERLLGIIHELGTQSAEAMPEEDPGIGVDQLPQAVKHAVERLDFFWDDRDGSWGLRRKVPIGMNVVWELTAGNRQRGLLTLEKQSALLDPVWGGIYQYSAAEDWGSPHFEKLMTYQGPNLEAYALGGMTERAKGIARYIGAFLTAPDGTFYVNQDADLNAHARSKGFVEGKEYYARDDAGRRALGVPWVDMHVYARENGVAIAALLALGDEESIGRARKAAGVLARTHVLEDGSVKHEAKSAAAFYLADAAQLGLAFARLAVITGDVRDKWVASRIAAALSSNFGASGAFYDVTKDSDAAGVFARRQKSFVHNVVAARLLAAVGERQRGLEVLAGISSTDKMDAEGAWVGEYLLAARELGVTR